MGRGSHFSRGRGGAGRSSLLGRFTVCLRAPDVDNGDEDVHYDDRDDVGDDDGAPRGGDRWSCAPDPCQIITQVMPHTHTHTHTHEWSTRTQK